jgi:anti-sigma B factor antagonist
MTYAAAARSPRPSRRVPIGDSPVPADAGFAREQLTIIEHHVGRRAVLAVAGEVDIQTAADLQTAIETAGNRALEIWVDLSDTTFMDSSGLHALVAARAHLTRASRRLVLICPQGPVLRVLTLTGLDHLRDLRHARCGEPRGHRMNRGYRRPRFR